MAVMHPTTLVPSKLELLAAWLPTQPWFHGDAAALERVGAYRLDDPAGEVGLEGLLLTAGDATVIHVPLSYRAAPLPDGEAFLVGTMTHGVLGQRWVSDAVGDPVYRAVIARIIAQGGREADEFVAGLDGALTPREIGTRLAGSGASGEEVPDLGAAVVLQTRETSRAESDLTVLEVVRTVDLDAGELPDQLVLRATWPGSTTPAILARLFSA